MPTVEFADPTKRTDPLAYRGGILGGAEARSDPHFDGAPVSVRVTFHPLRNAGPGTLHVGPAVAAALGVSRGHTVELQVGRVRAPLRVDVVASLQPGDAWVSPGVLKALRLPAGLPLRLHPRAEHRFEAGPFIGVLGPPRRAHNPYMLQTDFFRRLARYGRHHHLGVFIFSPGEVNWRARTVRGWLPAGNRGWIARSFPLPQAVYDRAHPTPSAIATLRRFHRIGVPVFNTAVGSKWWQYRLFRTDPLTRNALPETRLVTSVHDLSTMLRRHGSVYVKAAHGGKGIDIWRLTAMGGGRVAVQHTNRVGRARGVKAASLGAVARAILQRRRSYIVQERLSLLRWRQRIFDIRALVQKDETGRWQLTGMGLRVGPPGSIVSNLHGGGRTEALEPVLAQVLKERDVATVKDECQRLALRIAELIDGACTRVGELGIDLALDTSERVWILEANSRTGRTVFRNLDSPELARAADTRPLHYATWLANFA